MNFGFDRNHMRHKYLDLMRLKIPFVAPWYHQYVQVNGEDFSHRLKQLVTYGDQWKGVRPGRWSTSATTQKSQASFAKAKLNCKQGVQFELHLDYIVSQVDN